MRNLIKTLFIALCIIPLIASAQSYKGKEILKAADTTLHIYIGNVLFPHCKYLKKGYYSYIDTTTGIKHWAMIKKHRHTKGKLQDVHLSYKLDYDFPNCSAYHNITGIIYLHLNNKLGGVSKPDMSFIPDFVFTGQNCRLMTHDEALKMALKEGFKPGNKDPKMDIDYDTRTKQFTWTITNRIQKDSTLQKKLVVQTMRINAGTRRVTYYVKAPPEPKPQH